MKIRINGKHEDVAGVKTLKDVVKAKSLKPDHIIIEYNFNIVNNERWDEILLKDDDVIEIISFVGGG